MEIKISNKQYIKLVADILGRKYSDVVGQIRVDIRDALEALNRKELEKKYEKSHETH